MVLDDAPTCEELVSTRESGNKSRRRKNLRAKELLLHLIGKDRSLLVNRILNFFFFLTTLTERDLSLQVGPQEIKSIKDDPLRIFKFIGIPEFNLSNVSSTELDALEKVVEAGSAKAEWNLRVCTLHITKPRVINIQRLIICCIYKYAPHYAQEKPCLMVPIPVELLKTYVSPFDSSLYEEYANALRCVAELEDLYKSAQSRINELEREREEGRLEKENFKTQISRYLGSLST